MDPLKKGTLESMLVKRLRSGRSKAVIAEYVKLKPISMTLTADLNLVSYVKSRLRGTYFPSRSSGTRYFSKWKRTDLKAPLWWRR